MFLGNEPKKEFVVREKYNKTGRNRIFETPDDLWKSCCDYFEWVESNPLQEERVYVTKRGLKRMDINKKRAMTIRAMCVFIGITSQGYDVYRKRKEYNWVTSTVEDIIYSQKFEGAAAGMLNANIIARELGLIDKQEVSGGISITKKNFNEFYNTDT